MSSRYSLRDGIVIRRTPLPSGDVVVTLLSDDGKWRGVVRKGKRIGGNAGRLSLFHDVTVQYYQRQNDDLAVVTQVQLNGALPRLSDPAVYPYAHLLAELSDKLTADVHPGERLYDYLASGLRGLVQHPDPEAVALVMSWRLLQQAGLAPRVVRCVTCGSSEVGNTFDIAAGGMTCVTCDSGTALRPDEKLELQRMMVRPVREGLELSPTYRDTHWRLLRRYLSYHVGELSSLANLHRASTTPSPNSATPAG
ncbi:MAG: DNA repair protein RecO [Trueperaceae bacterium]|nr:DNA repair protein RecO [Trueperaceae bacterium]